MTDRIHRLTFHGLSLVLKLSLTLLLSTSAFAAENPQYREIDWIELIPDADLEALRNPPEWIFEVEDGTDEDDASLFSSERAAGDPDSRFMQALTSKEVKPEMNGQHVRVPGFIVPLAFDDRRRTIEFFLVPYFGACLHLPPPPPNQIIYVNFEQGIEMEHLYDPYWVEGILKTTEVSNEVAEAAYHIGAAKVWEYE
jgi:uncharacterized protein